MRDFGSMVFVSLNLMDLQVAEWRERGAGTWGRGSGKLGAGSVERGGEPRMTHDPRRGILKQSPLRGEGLPTSPPHPRTTSRTTTSIAKRTENAQGPHRLVVRTSRCGRDNSGSTPGVDILRSNAENGMLAWMGGVKKTFGEL